MTVSVFSLFIAVFSEVGTTLALRMASVGSRLWWIVVGVGYIVAFAALNLSLKFGTPLGVAYGFWAAAGVALTAIAGHLLFGERLTWLMALGIALIIGGVLLVQAGAAPSAAALTSYIPHPL